MSKEICLKEIPVESIIGKKVVIMQRSFWAQDGFAVCYGILRSFGPDNKALFVQCEGTNSVYDYKEFYFNETDLVEYLPVKESVLGSDMYEVYIKGQD